MGFSSVIKQFLIVKTLLIIFVMFLTSSEVFCKSFSEYSFRVGEFNDGDLAFEYINSNFSANSGLSIELTYDYENEKLYVSENISFEKFASKCYTILRKTLLLIV